MEVLSIGSAAPAFCLPDKNTTEVCLNAFAGKWVILYFYPKDNTPGCTAEAKAFNEELEAFSALNAEVIGISADSCESHAKFAGKHSLNIQILSDVSHTVIDAYRAWRPKKILGREVMGIVRSTYIIDPDGVIRAAWPKVRVAGHVDDVKARLEELRSPSPGPKE